MSVTSCLIPKTKPLPNGVHSKKKKYAPKEMYGEKGCELWEMCKVS